MSLEILQAHYGANNSFADVSEILRSAIVGGGIQIAVNNGTMGGDPLYGTRKVLVVDYVLNGTRDSVTINENEVLAIGSPVPVDSMGQTILGETPEGNPIYGPIDGPTAIRPIIFEPPQGATCECFRAPCDCGGAGGNPLPPGRVDTPIIEPPLPPSGDNGGNNGNGGRSSFVFWLLVGAAVYAVTKS